MDDNNDLHFQFKLNPVNEKIQNSVVSESLFGSSGTNDKPSIDFCISDNASIFSDGALKIDVQKHQYLHGSRHDEFLSLSVDSSILRSFETSSRSSSSVEERRFSDSESDF